MAERKLPVVPAGFGAKYSDGRWSLEHHDSGFQLNKDSLSVYREAVEWLAAANGIKPKRPLEPSDRFIVANYCFLCGRELTPDVARAIWHGMVACKGCARGLNPDGFHCSYAEPLESEGENG